MDFIPKGYVTLKQAMKRAGPFAISDRVGNELDDIVSGSSAIRRREQLVNWFRREFHAKTFTCSYWSDSDQLVDLPSEAFGLDESRQLFERKQSARAPLDDVSLTFSPDGSLDLRAGALTWIDDPPGSRRYFLNEIESAHGRELYVSVDGFEYALKAFGRSTSEFPVSKRAANRPALLIANEAIQSLWPSGIPRTLRAQERDTLIIEWCKKNGRRPPSVTTIRKALRDR